MSKKPPAPPPPPTKNPDVEIVVVITVSLDMNPEVFDPVVFVYGMWKQEILFIATFQTSRICWTFPLILSRVWKSTLMSPQTPRPLSPSDWSTQVRHFPVVFSDTPLVGSDGTQINPVAVAAKLKQLAESGQL